MSGLLSLVWPATTKGSAASYREPAAESGITQEEPAPRVPKKRTVDLWLLAHRIEVVNKEDSIVKLKSDQVKWAEERVAELRKELDRSRADHAKALKDAHEAIATYAYENDL